MIQIFLYRGRFKISCGRVGYLFACTSGERLRGKRLASVSAGVKKCSYVGIVGVHILGLLQTHIIYYRKADFPAGSSSALVSRGTHAYIYVLLLCIVQDQLFYNFGK